MSDTETTAIQRLSGLYPIYVITDDWAGSGLYLGHVEDDGSQPFDSTAFEVLAYDKETGGFLGRNPGQSWTMWNNTVKAWFTDFNAFVKAYQEFFPVTRAEEFFGKKRYLP